MSAGAVSHADCFFLVFKKYPVLRAHPFPRTAMETAINLCLFIPCHFYFPRSDQRPDLSFVHRRRLKFLLLRLVSAGGASLSTINAQRPAIAPVRAASQPIIALFLVLPQWYWPNSPVALITRWQGIKKATGLPATAEPTAREAFGLFSFSATSV